MPIRTWYVSSNQLSAAKWRRKINGYDNPGPSEPSGFAAKWHHAIPVMARANTLLMGIKSLRYESIGYN
ncbi:hypothetical protein MA16_Dca022022 [Dendrobium catenatum]|uniref:Uncharacterized protein n=1 Tax=Dendrobium catenatum TaxID=906689 RepID=A0A2I0X6B0_9ASPA|nr:hypothetical protein MA16_Dca022022 [Dendrobium catenatum]